MKRDILKNLKHLCILMQTTSGWLVSGALIICITWHVFSNANGISLCLPLQWSNDYISRRKKEYFIYFLNKLV